jgi:Protein of unknown function (DUF3500)
MNRSALALVLCCVGSVAAGSPNTTPRILAAANGFLATLTDAQKAVVQFERNDTAQKQRWSNLPGGIFERAGLTWGEMNETQRAAWLAVMQVTLSAAGYQRVLDQWHADDALATPARGGGRGPLFGSQYYYIALIGAPSATEPWQWQWGGHHVTINATIVGPNLSLSPSYIGVEPGTYTDTNGKTVRPLGDIERDAFALVNWLDGDQQRAAILGGTPINVVLGPGQDGKTIAPEGLSAVRMSSDQRDALLRLVGRYVGLVNDEDAAARTADVRSTLDQTYFAWYGPTTPGTGVYFRVSSPTLVIEYGAQGAGAGGGARTPNHVHGIYREPGNDYGARYIP